MEVYEKMPSGKFYLKEQTADPGTGDPSTGYGVLYCKSDGKVYFKNDDGDIYDLTYAQDEKVKADSGDPTAGYLADKVQNSIEVDTANHKLQLVGDSASPGANKYYGTDSAGDKGWYDLPSTTDEKVKADSGEPTAGYLEDKVDNATLEVDTTNHYLQVKDGGIGPSKIDSSGSYTMASLTTSGDISCGGDLSVTGNVECSGDVYAGDLVFKNGYRFTERGDALVLLDPDGNEVLFIDREGLRGAR